MTSTLVAQPLAPGSAGGSNAVKRGQTYWRSLDDLADTPEFQEFVAREFPTSATELLSSNDRRQFLKIMGASLALAGMGIAGAGCRRWPEEKIAPYAHRPAGRSPGIPVQYATSRELGGVASALLATSFDGRPIKVDGNPDHPIARGASDVHIQASILDLYDPDRSQHPLRNGEKSDWEAFTAWAKSHFTPETRSTVAILCEATSSPSVQAMRQRLQGVRWFEYEPLRNDNVIEGGRQVFGKPYRTHYAFDQAKTVVALDSDFLHCDGGAAAIKWTRDFAAARRSADDGRGMCRLYAFESGVSLTGANADHRVALRSADVGVIAARIAAEIASDLGAAALAATEISTSLNEAQLSDLLSHLVHDLKNAGPSVILAGPRQPAEVHALAHLMNQALGNVGKTVFYTPLADDTQKHLDSITRLAADINAGSVRTLVIIGGNPVYNAPVDLDFAALLAKVETTIHLSDYVDETSCRKTKDSGSNEAVQCCTWHINRAHYLEAWGDGRSYDGTVTIAQPLIEPLFKGRSAIELLAAIAGETPANGYEIVRWTFSQRPSAGDFETGWRKALHDGFIADSADQFTAPPEAAGQAPTRLVQALQQRWTPPAGEHLEVNFVPDASVYDGRFANNGWLQEMPDPLTKLTWDNAVLMNPSTAKERGLRTGDKVGVIVGEREVTAAVMLMPGQYAGSVTLALGYGRTFAGRICTDAGFDFYALRTSQAMDFANASVNAQRGSYVLATTQDHHPVDSVAQKAFGGVQDRLPTLFREASLNDYHDHPDFVKHRTHVVHRLSLWEEDHPFHSEEGRPGARYAWAMSIDLTACTGCNACVIACQAENNVPIVGKDQIKRCREMHWLRVDRYFRGFNEAYPDSYMMAPIPCMQCENAPCEQVCPVAATTHDTDGLNVMVYNRCIGTRYCSNNCPYKVRRFNYFDYHRREPHREQPGVLLHVEPEYYTKGQAQADPLRQLQFNPEVTVRSRGVMEKCTYCVQRITKARVSAKNDWVRRKNVDPNDPAVQDLRVPIADGSFTTACAQACPAQAIVFGDMNDPNSRVSQLHKHRRTYEMLEEINTKPRTRFMAKIRNPAFGGEDASDAHGASESHSAPAATSNGGHG